MSMDCVKGKERPPEKDGYFLVHCDYGYWHYIENSFDGMSDCLHTEDQFKPITTDKNTISIWINLNEAKQ